jgi:hypothetical protein
VKWSITSPAAVAFAFRNGIFTTFVIVFLVVALQFATGAYEAGFDGHPDEAAHFVSGLMVYDFLTHWTSRDVMSWAVNYYLHYPKVAIGHWPPGFPLMEALWWIPTGGPSRTSTILLEGLLAVISGALFLRLARKLTSPPVALIATVLLLTVTASTSSYSLAMAEIPGLLWSVLLLQATVRILECPSKRSFGIAALWVACALLTKGTGACLVPVPFIALILGRRWNVLPVRTLAWTSGVVVALGSVWYFVQSLALHNSLAYWGGISFSMPWPAYLAIPLAGYGFFALALGGIAAAVTSQRPEALAAASLLLSSFAVTFVLRAMNDTRHWIIVLPAVLLLSIESLTWLSRYRWVALAAGLAAIVLCPFRLQPVPARGYQRFTTELRLPARMLVSSNHWGEGGWIAAVALADQRPASVVIRATKSLAAEGWNGENYKLLEATPAAVSNTLDELGVETVVVQNVPGYDAPPHQILLTSTVESSASWRQCAKDDTLTAWCRTRPPTVPRRPLQVDLRNRIGRVIQETP